MRYRFIFLVLISFCAFAQHPEMKTLLIYTQKANEFSQKNALTSDYNEYLLRIAKSFIGDPYLSHTLDTESSEKLVVRLDGFDCTTYVESVLALARTLRRGGNYQDFCRELEFVRYRGGKLNGYCSRLHYFSEWIIDNIQKGTIIDVTASMGGKEIRFSLNFMSTHVNLYTPLKGAPERIDSMRHFEQIISGRKFSYIPKEEVRLHENDLRDGDIVAFTTAVPGLDIGHVGFVLKGKDGSAFLLHAPQEGSNIRIASETLGDYIMKVKKHSGIIVLRPLLNGIDEK
jgi:hypothetical protein